MYVCIQFTDTRVYVVLCLHYLLVYKPLSHAPAQDVPTGSTPLASALPSTLPATSALPPTLTAPQALPPALTAPQAPPPTLTASATAQTQAQAQVQARANALKAAVTNFRLKQLRSFVQSLPPERRPQNLQELREALRTNNPLMQVSMQAARWNGSVHVPCTCTSYEFTHVSLLLQGLPPQLNASLQLDPLVLGATPGLGANSSDAGKLPATFFIAPPSTVPSSLSSVAAQFLAPPTTSTIPSTAAAHSKGYLSSYSLPPPPPPSSTVTHALSSSSSSTPQGSFPSTLTRQQTNYDPRIGMGSAQVTTIPPSTSALVTAASQKEAGSFGGVAQAGLGRMGVAASSTGTGDSAMSRPPVSVANFTLPTAKAPAIELAQPPPPPPYPSASLIPSLPPSLPHGVTPSLTVANNPVAKPAVSATATAAAVPAPPTSQPTNRSAPLGPIQPGIPTPLPGLSLESLAALCKLPEDQLVRLQLPPGLVTAIRVWRMRQNSNNSSGGSSSSNGGTAGTEELVGGSTALRPEWLLNTHVHTDNDMCMHEYKFVWYM